MHKIGEYHIAEYLKSRLFYYLCSRAGVHPCTHREYCHALKPLIVFYMSGFFGCVSRNECVNEVFYGTDYHSHLGTKRAGMAFVKDGRFIRSIHSLEDGYFRNKFESELPRFLDSNMGIGVISDSESQPITITSHVGRYAVVTVARIDNLEELTQELLNDHHHFAELSESKINATEQNQGFLLDADPYRPRNLCCTRPLWPYTHHHRQERQGICMCQREFKLRQPRIRLCS